MSERRALLVAALLVLALPQAAAASGDAGSGRDAGDGSASAVSISPGTHHGNLTGGTDTTDTYRLTLTDQNLARFTLTSTGPVFARLLGPTERGLESFLFVERTGAVATIVVPVNGDWYLQVTFDAPVASGSVVPYTLGLVVESPRDVRHAHSTARSTVLEAEWSRAADVTIYQRIDVAAGASDPTTVVLVIEYDIVQSGQPFRGSRSGAVHFPALGSHVVLQDAEAELPLDVEINVTAAATWVSYQLRPGSTGSVRVITIDAGTRDLRPNVHMSVASTQHMTTASATSDDVIAWGSADTASVAAPGIAAYSARSTTLNVTAPFYGLFMTHDETGRSIDPNGTVRNHGTLSMRFLLRPVHGTWRFELDAAVGTRGEAAQLHLVGAFIPSLGLAP